jgi:hypothetical protein
MGSFATLRTGSGPEGRGGWCCRGRFVFVFGLCTFYSAFWILGRGIFSIRFARWLGEGGDEAVTAGGDGDSTEDVTGLRQGEEAQNECA